MDSDHPTQDVGYELPGNLAALRDGEGSVGPSHHTLEKRRQRLSILEQDLAVALTALDDLKLIQEHIQSAPVKSRYALPLVNGKLREMRQDIGFAIRETMAELERLKENAG